MKLLSQKNHKIDKSNAANKGFFTKILHLSPYKTSGYNVCPMASVACRTTCLHYAGFGRYRKIREAREKRTKLWFENRDEFKRLLTKELNNFVKYCAKHKKKPAIRLNGTSDISWEIEWPELFKEFPQITFYDYTKNHKRFFKDLPKNYYLLFSRSESNEAKVKEIIHKTSFNVAVVFKDKLPKTYMNRPVIDGDRHDMRFLDKSNCVIGLRAKGKAKKDVVSGFVIL